MNWLSRSLPSPMARTALEDRNQSKTAFLRFFVEESRFPFLQGRAALLGRDGMSTLSRKGMGELARAIIVGHAPARKGGGRSRRPARVKPFAIFFTDGRIDPFHPKKRRSCASLGKDAFGRNGKAFLQSFRIDKF